MAKFTLLSMNAAEFPTIQPLEGNLDFAIKDNILRDLLSAASMGVLPFELAQAVRAEQERRQKH